MDVTGRGYEPRPQSGDCGRIEREKVPESKKRFGVAGHCFILGVVYSNFATAAGGVAVALVGGLATGRA